MKRFWLLLCLVLPAFLMDAQDFLIKGRVIDADTKEGIPYSNVYFEGTTIGTSTDFEGYYELPTAAFHDTLVASALGYALVKKKVKRVAAQTVNFSISQEELRLSEVVVFAGENPAHRIVRNIIQNKDRHRLESLNAYQCESYTKVELDLENIDRELQEKKLFKPFKFVFEQIDSTSDEEPFLPVYMSETLADVYYIKGAHRPKRIVRAQRTSDVHNQSIIERIKDMNDDIDIYDNWIEILEKPFAGPFSNTALSNYEYYLIDSAAVDGKWCFKIKFKPKRKRENTFFGDFWVADTTFAVQRIDMRMSPDVNINLVSRVIIFQEFTYAQERWLPVKQKVLMDFAPVKKSIGLICRRTETLRNFNINDDQIDSFYDTLQTDYHLEEVKKAQSYWEKARHEPLSKTEAGVYAMIDSIKSVPFYQTYMKLMKTVFKGYLISGSLEFGPYYSLYSHNPVEGSRVRFGIRTSKHFHDKIRLGAYLAYGFRDRVPKYGANLEWRISRKPWTVAGASFRKDISLNSQSSEDFLEGDFLSGAFRRNIPRKLIDVTESKVYYEKYWDEGFSGRITLLNRFIDPYGEKGGGFPYAYLPRSKNSDIVDTTLSTTELILKLRYAFEEKFVETRFKRISMGSSFPIIELRLAYGLNNQTGRNYAYQKLAFRYQHFVNLNPAGWFSYSLQGGKIFGTLPFLLLEVHPGNEALFLNDEAFNTMNHYEFSSDTYLGLQVEHHFDGFIFNRLPINRILNLRAVATFKAVMGWMSAENRAANQLNAFMPLVEDTYNGFRSPSQRPYMEAGVGIENILKVFRVDALWRLNYLDNIQARRFTWRLGFGFYF